MQSAGHCTAGSAVCPRGNVFLSWFVQEKQLSIYPIVSIWEAQEMKKFTGEQIRTLNLNPQKMPVFWYMPLSWNWKVLKLWHKEKYWKKDISFKLFFWNMNILNMNVEIDISPENFLFIQMLLFVIIFYYQTFHMHSFHKELYTNVSKKSGYLSIQLKKNL